MDMPQNCAKRMEGWLYVIRSNRFGLQNARKRFFILEDHHLNCFKSMTISTNENLVKRTTLDSYIRVSDNGRENIHRKVFFVFTLYNTSNHNDRLKLGARSSEEAARWIHSFQEVISPACGNSALASTRTAWQSLRFLSSKRVHHCDSIDWAKGSFTQVDPHTSDVVAPSPWTIFGCQNGLRLFKERKDRDSHGKLWDDHPAIMAVGVMDGASEAIFRTVMSLGPSRSEWDFSFYQGNVVEHLDGHTDIIHKQLYSYWLPRRMRRRDLLLRRYWRRDDDGTYVILYHSVYHKKCPQQKGYTRAGLKSGGYVITPVNYGKQSVVKHMLAIDWKYWKAYLLPSSSRTITISMLGRVAALREYVKANPLEYMSDFSSGDLAFSNGEQNEKAEEKNLGKVPSEHASLVELNDIGEEFFDVPEPTCCDLPDDGWPSDCVSEAYLQETRQKSSPGSTLVKKLHEFSVHKKGYVDLVETAEEDALSWCYGCTLKKDPSCSALSSCTTTDPSTFLIRGKSYLRDRKKIKANRSLMQLIGADWLKSDKREDNLGGRFGSIVQDYAKKGGPEFFFIVNIQVPGSTTYNLALYYMINSLQDSALLQSFVEGNDAYRNSRFKLIPYISKGSWIVKQSVGKKACLAGQALEINYIRGKNYIELDIDVGSSTVARGVVNLVLGYLSNLVIEMAFLLEANTEDELPEQLLGTCRLNHLDASKAVSVTEL